MSEIIELYRVNPKGTLYFILALSIVLVIGAIGILALIAKHKLSLRIGSFKIDMAQKESVKEPSDKFNQEIHAAKKNVEDYIRAVLAKQ